ncbi:hypothetical protein KFK09_026782 [Dendrobium nobile]|uniref:Uncharacterized protein n=1 Tax=Dendrobium nobile TaxID=94219 RepID=A0A8T3A8T7_DENNO|nr:hypothetical protein KFK09_026782 [Dendrobium nobile]
MLALCFSTYSVRSIYMHESFSSQVNPVTNNIHAINHWCNKVVYLPLFQKNRSMVCILRNQSPHLTTTKQFNVT